MTDDLLRIASEMEAGDSFDDSHGTNSQEVIKRRAWAARIRARVSPEAVAFFEAAKVASKMRRDFIADRVSANAVLKAAEELDLTYALLAAQEKGE